MLTEDATRPERAPAPGRRSIIRPATVDIAAALFLLALVPAVYNLGRILATPYWLDESWVALSMKAPLGELSWVTASTPLGWTMLLHTLPGGGQSQRLLPLAFLTGAVLISYVLGRRLPWPNRTQAVLAGLAAALAVLLLPAEQFRHDLKQYTADAFVAVLLFALVSWIESGWTRRRLGVLCATIAAGTLISHTTVFAGAAALGGLGIEALARRAWPRLRELLVFGAGTVTAAGLVYLVVDRPGRVGGLYSYWAAYLPSLGRLPEFLYERGRALSPLLGLPWWLYLLPVIAGAWTLARRRRPATALMGTLLLPLMIAAGVARQYPLLDLRTSNFLFVSAAAVAGIGVVGVGTEVADLIARRAPARSTAVAVALVAAVFGGYVWLNDNWLQSAVVIPDGRVFFNRPAPPAPEDVRSQVAYVVAHRQPGDVILVGSAAQYAFGWYWSPNRPRFEHTTRTLIRWQVTYPSSSRIVIVQGDSVAAVRLGVEESLTLATGHRIWVIRSDETNGDRRGWQTVLQGLPYTDIAVGVEPLGLIDDKLAAGVRRAG